MISSIEPTAYSVVSLSGCLLCLMLRSDRRSRLEASGHAQYLTPSFETCATRTPQDEVRASSCGLEARPSWCAASSAGAGDNLRLHRQQAFALHFLARELASTADRFRAFPGLLFGGLFVVAAQLHLAENPLALHLLLQRFEGLVDVIVTNENLHAGVPLESRVEGAGPNTTAVAGRVSETAGQVHRRGRGLGLLAGRRIECPGHCIEDRQAGEPKHCAVGGARRRDVQLVGRHPAEYRADAKDH